MKRSVSSPQLEDRVDTLESNLFQLLLVLIGGGFIVVGGLMSIIAAFLTVGQVSEPVVMRMDAAATGR